MSATAAMPAMPRGGTDAPALGWEATVVVLGGGVMLSLAFGALLPVLPRIDAALAHGERDHFLIKQLFGIVGLSVALSAPLAGYLVDRVGSRVTLLAGCTLFVLAGSAGLVIDSLPLLVFSRFLTGAAAAAVDTTSIAIINKRLAGDARARWNGLRIAFIMVFAVLMQPTSGALAQGFGWRAPFLLYLLGVPIGLVAAVGIGNERIARDAGPRASGWDWFPFRYAAVALVLGVVTYLPVVYGPFLLRARGVANTLVLALVLTGSSVIGAITSLAYGPAKRRLSIDAAFVICFACMAAGTLIAGTAPGVAGAAAGLLVFGLGLGWSTPNLMTAVGESVGHAHQGRAVGVVRTMHELAAFVCILAFEPVAARYGPAGAMAASALLALLLLATFGYRLLTRRQGS